MKVYKTFDFILILLIFPNKANFYSKNTGCREPDYLRAALNMPKAAEKIANLIRDVGIKPIRVHCIGYSLGIIY